MPSGDKTGPTGQGPMTGRKLGKCTGNEHAGFFEMTRQRFNRNKPESKPGRRRRFFTTEESDNFSGRGRQGRRFNRLSQGQS